MGILDQAVIRNPKEKTMNKFIKKLFGIDKIEAEVKEATKQKVEAELEAVKAIEDARIAKLSPKEIATEKKDPWVAVLDTHVNKDNIRNGFFELDWNEYFVLQLRTAGYTGESDEAIVDQWFSELCRNVGADTGVDMSRRSSGFINVNNLGDGRTEVS
jgi:phage I-like protein